MYAVLVEVQIKRSEDAIKSLNDQVVPQVKGAPGFVKGTWFGNEQVGHGLVIFETEEQAKQMAETITSTPDDPVQVVSVTVYRVHAEA